MLNKMYFLLYLLFCFALVSCKDRSNRTNPKNFSKMKNLGIYAFLLFSLFACKSTEIDNELPIGCTEQSNPIALDYTQQYVTIPDPSFEYVLVYWKLDSDGEVNGKMLMSDALKITELNVESFSSAEEYIIKDLTGIEYFKNLKKLSVRNCLEDSLDLTNNTQLADLSFFAFWGGGGSYKVEQTLSHLKMHPSNKLKSLELAIVWMKEIDISGFPNLESILFSSDPLSTIYVASKEQKERLVNNQTVITKSNQTVEYKVCRRND